MSLGGRAAEEIIFGKVSTGALSDLERVTQVAYNMVSIYGMNDRIGNVSFYSSKQQEYNFNKPYSEATAQIIDEEAKKIIADAYTRTLELLSSKKEQLEILAKELLKKEILFQADLERLIGKRPFQQQTTYEAFLEDEGKREVIAEEKLKQKKVEEEEKSKLEKEAANSTEDKDKTKETVAEAPTEEANK